MKVICIETAHCNQCDTDFEFVPGHINSISNRNSDAQGCPRCPSCRSYKETHWTGTKTTLVYSIRRSSQ